jgi:uncharacterized protein
MTGDIQFQNVAPLVSVLHLDSTAYISNMPDPVVHFEILGTDGKKLIDFYRELFGWPIEDGQLPGWPHYGFLKAERGIGGAVGAADAAPQGGVLVYIEVEDPYACIERAAKLGASVILPVTEVPGAEVTVAWLRDPQGNLLGLVKGEDD